MYAYHTGYVGQDRYDRLHGGDSFSRVMGRERDYRGPDRYTKRGLNQGYARYGDASPVPLTPAYSDASASTNRVFEQVTHEEPTPVQYGERVVKKLVQVPVTREVRVPTVVEKVVEGVEVREFPVSRVRQEQAVKQVQEEFLDYEERPATRMKEVWVRKEVPETYVERVPVKKVRTVDVPYTTTVPYTEMQRVEVPVTKVVEEPSFRVDEVVELETHEVEGRQRVEWIPRVVDEVVAERDLGVRDRQVVDRRTGQLVYPSYERSTRPHSPYHEASYNRGAVYPATSPVGVGAWDHLTRGDSYFGIYVKESVVGLLVKAVVPGSYAEAAGIHPGDIIQTVDGVEVYSIEEWRRAVGRKRAATLAYRSKRLGRSMKVQLTQ